MQNVNRWTALFKDDIVISSLQLSAAWIPGLLLGAFIGSTASEVFAPYLQSAYRSCASFLGLSLSLLIPLLLTVVLERCFGYASVLLVAFFKAFSFSVSATACVLTCGSAGWLVSGLLLFSDFLSILVLLWLWFCAFRRKHLTNRELLTACFCILLIGTVDYFIVSPFLASLFHF